MTIKSVVTTHINVFIESILSKSSYRMIASFPCLMTCPLPPLDAARVAAAACVPKMYSKSPIQRQPFLLLVHISTIDKQRR